MISQTPTAEVADEDVDEKPKCVVLVRYAMVPQVARFGLSEQLYESVADQLARNAQVVVNTDRGPEIGQVLEVVRLSTSADDNPVTGDVIRIASAEDLRSHAENRRRADTEFLGWQTRITNWKLQLQLIDIEFTLKAEQIVLYVLNRQDAETTRLALLAAAAGLGIVHVQPVSANGMVVKEPSSSGGGCGSGGCGSGGCGS